VCSGYSIPDMTIDPKTGNLLLGDESLGPTSQERDFLQSASGVSAKQVVKTPTTISYEIWLPPDSGREVGAVLKFARDGALQTARIKFVRSEDRAAGASGWSRDVEDEIKSFHDAWLRERFGIPPYELPFPWGRVWSVIDEHGYAAIIIVAYGPKH
jgi:hypothetical protein